MQHAVRNQHNRVTSDVSDYISKQKKVEDEKEEYRRQRARQLKVEADAYRYNQLKAYSNQHSPPGILLKQSPSQSSIKLRMGNGVQQKRNNLQSGGTAMSQYKKKYGKVSLESGWV